MSQSLSIKSYRSLCSTHPSHHRMNIAKWLFRCVVSHSFFFNSNHSQQQIQTFFNSRPPLWRHVRFLICLTFPTIVRSFVLGSLTRSMCEMYFMLWQVSNGTVGISRTCSAIWYRGMPSSVGFGRESHLFPFDIMARPGLQNRALATKHTRRHCRKKRIGMLRTHPLNFSSEPINEPKTDGRNRFTDTHFCSSQLLEKKNSSIEISKNPKTSTCQRRNMYRLLSTTYSRWLYYMTLKIQSLHYPGAMHATTTGLQWLHSPPQETKLPAYIIQFASSIPYVARGTL